MFIKTENFAFRFVFVIFWFVTISNGFGLMSFGQKPKAAATILEPKKLIERKLAGGQKHKYRFQAKANELLEVIIEQKGVDVVVKLFDASGKLLMEMDSPNGTQGFEILTFVIARAGVYTVEVGSLEANAAKGSYTIFRGIPLTATEKDKKTLQAETILSEANALFNEGTSESYPAAREKYLAASRLYREVGDKGGETTTLFGAGFISRNLGESQTALEYYNQALSLFQTLSDKSREAMTLHNIGEIYYELGENQKALDYYNQALLITRAIGDKSGEAHTLSNIGSVYDNLGEKQKALDYHNQALLIARAIGDKSGEARTLSNIGEIYYELGEKQKALDYLNQALPLFQTLSDKSREAITLNNIGEIYSKLGEKQKALDYYNQALPLRRAVNDKSGEATTLNNIGVVYRNLGEKQKALDYYNQALLIARAIGNKSGEATTLSNIGEIYSKLGEKQKALEYLNKSLLLCRAVNDKSGEATTLNNIGQIYSELGETEKALEYYQASLQLVKALGNKSDEAVVIHNLMFYWDSLNNRTLAILYGKQSVNAYQQLRLNIKGLNKQIQQTYLKSIEKTYRSLADILISEGRFPEAQAVLDLLKEEEFGQLVHRSGEPLFTLPYSRAEEEAMKVVDNLAALGRELGDLRAKGGKLTEAEKKRLNELEQTEIPAANKAFRLAVEALAKVAPDVEKTLAERMENNVQNILPALGAGTVALYTVVGKSDAGEKANKPENKEINIGWILLITPEFRKAYPIETKDLEQTVFNLLNELRSKGDPQPLAQEVYKKLFLQTSDKQKTTLAADLETYLGKHKDKTLMWSLDGFLRYVPMAALHDGKGYLVEKYRNVVFNTASLGSLKDAMKPNWEVVGLGVSEKKTVQAADGQTLNFVALEDAEWELRSLIKEKDPKDTEGIFPGTIKLNKDFSKQALFDSARTNAPVIHIASHFFYNSAEQKTSFLLLGDGGKLEMSEFRDFTSLFQNVDLLSLAACDTAKSSAGWSEADGEEVEGFAYAAQKLGAKSVIASLWKVSDEGTRELMLKFYEIRQKNPKLPKGEAMRQAQLSLLKNEKYAHPYFWSPFILIGNWK